MINRLYHIFEPMKLHELFEAEERSVLSVMGKKPEVAGGFFSCEHLGLTSLKGSPRRVNHNFYCQRNNLTSFEGGPERVGGTFLLHSINLHH